MRTISPVLAGAAIAWGIAGTWAIASAQGPATAKPLKLSDHVTVIPEGQPGAQQDIDATGAAEGRGVVALFKGMPNRAADMEGAVYRTPDVTFAGDAVIDLGGTRVQLMELGPTHTNGDVGFFVEGDGVVFTGDVAMSAPIGINSARFTSAPSKARVWLASLERLMAFKPRHVVPAHGPLGDASMIDKHRVFMTAVRDRVSALKEKRQTADQIAAAVTSELAGKHQVPEKIVGDTARLFYVELP